MASTRGWSWHNGRCACVSLGGQLANQLAKMGHVEERAAIDNPAFTADVQALAHAVGLAIDPPVTDPLALDALPESMPQEGIGPDVFQRIHCRGRHGR